MSEVHLRLFAARDPDGYEEQRGEPIRRLQFWAMSPDISRNLIAEGICQNVLYSL